MEVKAVGKYVRVQPRKVRIIADKLRGSNAMHTVSVLRYHTSKSAKALRKVLVSAMANAAENNGLSPETLKISTITVDEGPRLKRLRARAMGRGNRIVKKTAHITVVVEEAPEILTVVKPHGTKPKPRPTFGAPKKGKKTEAKSAPVAEAPVAVEEVVESVPETPEEVAVEAAEAEGLPAEEATEEASETESGESN